MRPAPDYTVADERRDMADDLAHLLKVRDMAEDLMRELNPSRRGAGRHAG